MINREHKILRISQAHLAPGMSLSRWEEIMKRHNIALDRADGLDAASDETIEAIWGEIAGT